MRVFRESQAILGESLVWDAEGDSIWWCDITAGLVHRSPLSGGGDSVLGFPAPLGSFHLTDDGGFVLSLEDRVVLADSTGAITRELARIPHARPGLRMNEGKVDPAGRWVTGSMTILGDNPDAAYYAIAPSGELTVLAAGLGVANGLEWSPAGDRIWFTDTSVETIYTGTYADDEIGEVEPWHRGAPHDGLTMATDGTFWGALYGEGKVVHYAADATELEAVELPAPNLTSVVLDGSGTLYVCSARENLTEEQLEAHPLSGSIFAIDTSTTGRPARRFSAVR